jgi:hypothetical protein
VPCKRTYKNSEVTNALTGEIQHPRTKNLEGKRIGKWEVIRCVGRYKPGGILWECRCDCGIIKSITSQNLLAGITRSCVTCANPKRPYGDQYPPPLWKQTKKRAASKGFEFTITREEAYALFLKQKKRCALSGISIQFPETGTAYLRGETTASLDRIDSRKGYIPTNIQWVHKTVNFMKNKLDEATFIGFCIAIAHSSKSKFRKLLQTNFK